MSSAEFDDMSGYRGYYLHTMREHTAGLKLVGGGTGLGKTSGIVEVVKHGFPSDCKAIYVANRLQLVDEMFKRLGPDLAVVLPRDLEAVRATFVRHRYAFDSLITSPFFEGNAENIDLAKLRRLVKTLDEIFKTGEEGWLSRWQEDAAADHARALLKLIRSVLLTAKGKSLKDHTQLLDHEAVQNLFPFIAFQRRPQAKILLVSLQKLFYGFFDGETSLTAANLANYIIFADEFDFLENELIGLIARSTQIDDPFRFVEFFYREMERHKWQLATYPVSASANIRRRIGDIMDEIRHLQATGIRYPNINQFISSQHPQDAAIFRTSHTLSSTPLYLCQTERAFDIILQREACVQETFNARQLFTTVSGVCERILTLLKELEAEDPLTHRGLIADCYHNTTFPEQIAQIAQFPRHRRSQKTQLGTLLDTGYGMYDIHYMDKVTDPEEVELRSYAIYTTPEKFIATLAEKNLLFALSATADIPRCVNHFNLAWLGRKEGINLIAPDDLDKQIVAELNAQKAALRGNHLHVVQLTDLDSTNSGEKELRRLINTASKLEGFGQDTKEGHLKQRVERFFASVLWAARQSEIPGEVQSHLMFLNTYRQIEFFFTTEALRESALYRIKPRSKQTLFTVYELEIAERHLLVVFYNAEQAKRVRQSVQSEQDFSALFQEGLRVIIVTQYLSAGNGVNLQYRLADGRERDLLNLHLLEAPYYYFNPPSENDTHEERVAKLKENLWYVAKLHAAKYLSEHEFIAKLGTVHQPQDWNQAYQHHPRMYADYQLNTVAALIQALGRVERVWEPLPDQTVVLCREAYHAFQQFLAPEFDGIREAREPMISQNVRQVLEKIAAQVTEQQRAIWRSKDSRLARLDQRCREEVDTLLNQFEAVRRGVDAARTRYIWQHLREACLKHDFGDETLQAYSCTFTSRHIRDATVNVTPDQETIPSHLAQPDTYCWRLNAAYDVISDNHLIRDYFVRHGYELDFSLDQQTALVPYCYQSILVGAIGEEAVRALLLEHGFKFEEVPDALFEVADLKIENLPWYIDCKNYSDDTLERFALTPLDSRYYYKLSGDYFRQRAVEKWHLLADQHGPEARLIYINLATNQDRPLQYFQCIDGDLQEATRFDDAQVVVVQGALNTFNPDEYQLSFTRFLLDMERYQ